MADELLKCYNELIVIKKYLVKKGKSRFEGNITKNQLSKVNDIINRCNNIISQFSLLKDVNSGVIEETNKLYIKITTLHKEILELCSKPEVEENTSTSSDSEYSECDTMEFDLKSACSLIPLMDGTEETTKRLIDAVDMYSGMLNEIGKKSLITFVLKGRLSESAKLRVSATYLTVEQLISDLRNSLLPKKSFTAIHSRLQNISQGWRSIDQYGSEIEKLFSELTITQAEGNSASYDVLKPLNEKMCIKKFTDGLKDPRLSTIIAARNFSSLKDAIQAAQDEEVSRPTTSSQPEIMAYHHESIGALENSHKTMGAYLRIQCENKPNSWSDWLPYWCFTYNNTVHTETKYTPHELVFGKLCILPSNLRNSNVNPLYNHGSYPLELKYRLELAQADARTHLINSKLKRKEKYDSHSKPVSYSKSSYLWLRNVSDNKMQSIYVGPYLVLEDLGCNVKILKNGKEDVVHKNRTKPCIL
ncbi:uncharacterized protein LOC125239724 [Leguminivora glycinivorella]|uniref:uncharacterized protein LOC125239724 n=1 Tax=Leguminivora glycinivorella TaxID=1035111 RepID=UPI00200BACC4|nr:uncharacterized protein LOC125239724 [Leguminivora glycinivorella]